MPHSGGNPTAITLNLHPATAAESLLPFGQVAVDALGVDCQALGQSLKKARQLGPVRFAGAIELENLHAIS
jgi:hypothetical protein